MESLLLQIAEGFDHDVGLPWLKALAIAWSGADLLLIVAVLRMAGTARARAGKPPVRVRWVVFWATALLTPGLVFIRTDLELFYLDAVIAIPQYAVLVWSMAVERDTVCAWFRERIAAGEAGART